MKYENGKIYIEKKSGSHIYTDVILLGVILSSVLNIFGSSIFCIYQLMLILVMMLLYGLNKSVERLVIFVKIHIALTLSFIIWILMGLYLRVDTIQLLRIISIYFIIFAGYLYVQRVGVDGLRKSLGRLVILLIIAVILGLLWYFSGSHPLTNISELAHKYITNTNRITSIWLHPIPCACFVGIMILLCSGLYDGIMKLACLVLGLVALILTQSRSAWIAVVITLLVYNYYKLQTFIKLKIKKKTILWMVFILVILVGGGYLFRNQILSLLLLIEERLFREKLGTDMSFVWRLNSIVTIFSKSLSGNVIELLFGHGMYSGGEVLSAMNFGNIFKYNVGTVDNSYISALYDYGILGAIWLVGCIMWIIRICLSRKTSFYPKIIGSILLLLLIMAAFFEELYWCNISYVFFVFIGIELGLINCTNSKRRYWKKNGN